MCPTMFLNRFIDGFVYKQICKQSIYFLFNTAHFLPPVEGDVMQQSWLG